MSWRGGWMVSSLLVLGAGCGGALPGEEVPAPAEEAEERLDGSYCLPTEDSTQRVKTILPPSDIGIPRYASSPSDFVRFKGQLHFAVNYEDGKRALWRSNGAAAGTTEIKSLPATEGNFTPPLGGLTPTSSLLFFRAADVVHGTELWVSDGTSGGTRMVEDLTPGTASSYPTHMTATGSGSVVFFLERYESGSTRVRYELWASDGSAGGTSRVRDFGADAEVSYLSGAANNTLRFFVRDLSGGTSLWKTDGTSAGTVQVKRLTSGPNAFIKDARTQDGLTLFILRQDSGLQELWKTDGTSGGTLRLASFGATRDVRLLGALGSTVYVTTTSLTTQYMVLYQVPLAGGTPTSVVSLPNDYTSLGEAFPSIDSVSIPPGGSKLFFSVIIGSNGPAPRDSQLWVTDGTAGGTVRLRRPLSLSDEYASPVYAVSDDLVFFSAYEADGGGIEPWVSNGTPSGTRKLRDIANTALSTSSYPREYFRLGSRVYFSAYDDTEAGQLWSTQLTDACFAPQSQP
ncbi:hypothetical protein K8640_37550 [Myxococcus sp. XM-1-1-1]|uniref:ELWxxDGT repeat protein n=1 Tax=Myxococcus sp. XM-1-1-1 TaxID=2874602 RepID=UPI001CBE655F|nr:ELWxxDGT repeat protein [Myxococcus sp. XM-1-1-1]MBZ4413945.1 hypothetical protein [Myxococcus sp. XM-1-1-1]